MKILLLLSFLVAVRGYETDEIQTYFNAIDKNHDGELIFLEWATYFMKYDTDADGIASLQEFSAMVLPETRPAVVNATYSFYVKMDGASGGLLRYPRMHTQFKYFDLNNDSKISFKEYKKTCNKVFNIVMTKIQTP